MSIFFLTVLHLLLSINPLLFLSFFIASHSNLPHRKIPSIINRLMCFLFPIYYEGRIAY
ncbi:hypothetical protein BCAH1134_C0042 (plasmid) [Bacillus cereus AH1134]|nr:hypothetical protein BCAH1134_C0042 [Bacillus cereus AH1134]